MDAESVSDIRDTMGVWLDLSEEAAARLDEVIGCDKDDVCCADGEPIHAGRYGLFGTQLAVDVPSECAKPPCQYNWGMANRENHQPANEIDVLGYTRWWYQYFDHGQGWTVYHIDSAQGFDPQPTQARVIRAGPVIACLIPASEFADATGFRASTFFYDHADVPGHLPSEQVTELDPGGLSITDLDRMLWP